MGKNINYNYVFVMYDVNEKRVNKVFKVCKKYLSHHQNSVFRGEITPSNLIKLKNDLKAVAVASEDFISIIKMISQSSFDEDNIGEKKANNGEDLFI